MSSATIDKTVDAGDEDVGLRALPKDVKHITKTKYWCDVCEVWVAKYDWDCEETCPRHQRKLKGITEKRLVPKEDVKKDDEKDKKCELLVRHHSLPGFVDAPASPQSPVASASGSGGASSAKILFERSQSWHGPAQKTADELIREQKYLESVGAEQFPKLIRQTNSLCRYCKKTNYQIFASEQLHELNEAKVPVGQRIVLVHKKWQALSAKEKELWATFQVWTKLSTGDEVLIHSLLAGVEPTWVTNVVREQNAWKIFQEAVKDPGSFDEKLLYDSQFFSEREKLIGQCLLKRGWMELDEKQRQVWGCRAKLFMGGNKCEAKFAKCYECVRGEDAARSWYEFKTNATIRPAHAELGQIVYELSKRNLLPIASDASATDAISKSSTKK